LSDSLVKYHDFGLYGFKVKLQVVKRQYLAVTGSSELSGGNRFYDTLVASILAIDCARNRYKRSGIEFIGLLNRYSSSRLAKMLKSHLRIP
jgi:hypothetical protein